MRSVELSRSVEKLEQEIDQRKQVEAELGRSNTRFRRLFEANIIGVIFSDIYGNITDANDAFLEMMGYSREDLPLRWDKMTPTDWMHLSDAAVERIMPATGSSLPGRKNTFARTACGYRSSSAALLEPESAECVFFVLDMSKLKNAEEQVRDVRLRLEHASRSA